ncbi:MAG: hypothetical protein Q4A83_00285 [Bacillota bacterium]|nr:hypothetical protein [Bacillota bacterium]
MTAMTTKELKKCLKKLSVNCFELTTLVCTITYLLFHYVTCDGITLVKQKSAGKPFLTMLFGNLGVEMFASGVMCALFSGALVEGRE